MVTIIRDSYSDLPADAPFYPLTADSAHLVGFSQSDSNRFGPQMRHLSLILLNRHKATIPDSLPLLVTFILLLPDATVCSIQSLPSRPLTPF